MPIQPTLMKRLVQAKQILLHGMDHAGRPGELNRLFAILAFDQAIEHFLNTILCGFREAPNVKRSKSERTFFQLLNDADQVLTASHGKQLENTEKIKFVHRLRNGAQHHGMIPSQEDLSRAKVYSEDFLKDSYSTCFSVDYHEVFLADSIESEKVRQHFKEAEKALSGGRIGDAVVELAKCFQYVLQDLSKKILLYRLRDPLAWKGSGYDALRKAVDEKNENDRAMWMGLKLFVDDVKNQVNELHERVEMLILKADLVEYDFFRSVTPQVGLAENGEFRVYRVGNPCESEEDCIRVFHFVYSVILAIEGLR